MTKRREIRSYDYVNHPYERVRDALKQDARTVFQSATKAAASRAQSVAAELHVDVGGIGVTADVRISVKKVEEKVLTSAVTPIPPTSTCSSAATDCAREAAAFVADWNTVSASCFNASRTRSYGWFT